MKIFTLLLISMIIVLNSCNTVRHYLNQHTISAAGQQKLALKENSFALEKLSSTDFTLNVGTRDFDSILIPNLMSNINGYHIKHVNQYSIKKVSSQMKNEQIKLMADFDVQLDTMDVALQGRLIGVISFSFKNDSIYLYPAFKYIHVNHISYKKLGFWKRRAIAGIINTILNSFIDKLNGIIVDKNPSIPLNLIHYEIANNELTQDPKTVISLSHSLKFNTSVKAASCLIDKNGIHLLGSLNNNKTDSSIINTNDFNTFQSNYITRRNVSFPDLPIDNNSFAAFSKPAIAQILNNALDSETMTLNYTSDETLLAKADKNITLDLNDIHCNSIQLTPPQFHVAPSCDNPVNFHCRGGILGAACRVAEAAAKASWYATVYGPCMATRAAELAINEGLKVTFEAAKLAAIGQCEVLKRSLIVVAGSKISVGDIHTSISAGGTGNSTISRLSFDKDLSGFNHSMNATANANFNASFGFTPEGPIGHLVCFLKFNHPYAFNANTSKSLPNEKMKIVFEPSANRELILKTKTNPIDFDIRINPTPLSLMNRDIATLINCPIVGLGTGLADLTKTFNDLFGSGSFGNSVLETIVNGKFNYKMKETNFSIPIKPLDLHFMNSQINLAPIEKKEYIAFLKF